MINAVGHDKESSFKAICEGECGIDRITIFDPSAQSAQIAGEVKNFDPESVMDAREVKKADRFIHLGIKAAQEAIKIRYENEAKAEDANVKALAEMQTEELEEVF